jgi:uncharacterized membrane protein
VTSAGKKLAREICIYPISVVIVYVLLNILFFGVFKLSTYFSDIVNLLSVIFFIWAVIWPFLNYYEYIRKHNANLKTNESKNESNKSKASFRNALNLFCAYSIFFLFFGNKYFFGEAAYIAFQVYCITGVFWIIFFVVLGLMYLSKVSEDNDSDKNDENNINT